MGDPVSVQPYRYSIDECDVPAVRRAALAEYRALRLKCLEMLSGEAESAVSNQIYGLAWHTALYRSLNEARRLEPKRRVNGAWWELTTLGYAHIMALGVRKLIDTDDRADSISNALGLLERRPELMRRECFVCYDGLPFDFEAVQRRWREGLDTSISVQVRWAPTRGPDGWSSSERLHSAFDALCGYPAKRRRLDHADPAVFERLRERLKSPAIEKVATFASRQFAHAERLAAGREDLAIPTYDEMDDALRTLVLVANLISSALLDEGAFGAIVPTPQFDVLDGLQRPWVVPKRLPELARMWQETSERMDRWAFDDTADLLPAKREAGDDPREA